MEEGGFGGGVVENDGVVSAMEGVREGVRLTAAERHGVGRLGGSDGLNTGRRGGRDGDEEAGAGGLDLGLPLALEAYEVGVEVVLNLGKAVSLRVAIGGLGTNQTNFPGVGGMDGGS